MLAVSALIALALQSPWTLMAADFPLDITDGRNIRVRINQPPQRVVCLVPAITETIVRLGQEDVLVGTTLEDLKLEPQLRIADIGSYFHPVLDQILSLKPDLVIAAPGQREVIEHFATEPEGLLVLDARRLEDGYAQIRLIGKLLNRSQSAEKIIRHNREQLELIKQRLGMIPEDKRKRVIRVVAGSIFYAPGDDSFQNQLIEAAGGIPPELASDGSFVPLSLQQWQNFDPQMVYGCNDNADAVRAYLQQPQWRDVTAIRNGQLMMFPCALTCQLGTHMGDFALWLAAVLYPQEMADPDLATAEDQILEERPLEFEFAYVKEARIVNHRVNDVVYRSLDVHFNKPQTILSTFEGLRSQIAGVGNTYVPMGASLGHMTFGPHRAKAAIAANLGYEKMDFSGMMTGADLNNLAQRTEVYKDLEVTALATAGVRGNAMRMSRDTGFYSSHGTINVLVMTNRKLSENAMARSIITATEAKSAALLDLDIRSSYSGLDYRATGTGTDNVIIVQGDGPEALYTGGHTKIGELIAKAVHGAVTDAISRQNGLLARRPVSQRLYERGLSLKQVAATFPELEQTAATEKLATLLKDPYYAAFLETALAVSDDLKKGLIGSDLVFNQLCIQVASRISDERDVSMTDFPGNKELPPILARAFGALLYASPEKD